VFIARLAPAACLLALVGALSACRNDLKTNSTSITVSNPTPARAPAHTNRLAREHSPYLLQHQHNPVDWHAWGPEAFEQARREGKPIFLSIGYSTCHWCHVMERESFENEDTARFLNEHFVSIKVDREERPDVDKIYMTFVQATTGSGGWPLNVFLTPELKPFFGGTYWPPERRHGRGSFVEVLQQIHTAWKDRREQLLGSSEEIHRQLERATQRETTNGPVLTAADLREAGRALMEGYDARHGGWGGAPKFPSPSHPAFVLHHGVRSVDHDAIRMVLHTCERMSSGGIYDQIGGGFSRYSVDEKWLVPHFEKMLYDNAQLLTLFLDCYLVSGEQRYADVARDILRYILRDMTHAEGGFYSAEDADSEGKEGKFYCWTRDELSQLLSPEEFNVASAVFGVTERGNFVDHSDPDPLPKQNVLSIVRTNLPAGDEALLKSAKEKMFAARARRVRPHLDDKILSSWNGLMLGGLARAYAVLGDAAYRSAAEKNLAFLRSKLWDPQERALYHRWRNGHRDQVQLLDAYANLLSGVLELYQATLDAGHLEFAVALADSMMARFYDKDQGGFWQSGAGSGDLILRVKEDYDGAEPSGNSVATLALLKLAAITEREDFRDAAEKTLRMFAPRVRQAPHAMPFLLQSFEFALEEPRRVAIAGDPKSDEAQRLLRAAHGVFQPNKVVLGTTGPVSEFTRKLPARDGRATVYLCTGKSCSPPTHEAETVKRFLQQGG
jgi:uncharacterized protein YyaL (SSP411 family)